MFPKLKNYIQKAIVALSVLPSVVLAQGTLTPPEFQGDPGSSGEIPTTPSYKLRQLGEGYLGFADKSPGEVIGAIISGVLTLLGVIFLVLMVWAGYNWMMAQGDPKKVDTAKDTIKNSIIGLALVLAAYGITRLVISLLGKAI